MIHFLMICLALSISACSAAAPALPPPAVLIEPVVARSPQPELNASLATPLPQPPSPVPFYVTATTWGGDLQTSVILFHRFLPYTAPESSKMKTRLSDFRNDLQALYDAGYSLVPLESWLSGDIHVPTGRRPLIMTMDDLFFADQISLDPDGSPSQRSGIGVLWEFSQDHPDFGFSVALFYNLGDKYYGNKQTAIWWNVSAGWEDSLAKAIIWCLDHGAIPYNHTFMHARLDQVKTEFIQEEISRNDDAMRKLLIHAGRVDLIPKLDNLIALPEGLWPASPSGRDYLLDYHNPEGLPVQAVMEAGFYYEKLPYLQAPFSPAFAPLHIARITTNTDKSIQFLVDQRDHFPLAGQCTLGPMNPAAANNTGVLVTQITQAIQSGLCDPGVYRVGNVFYKASRDSTQILWRVN